jgi:hypothetical protein
MAIKKVEYKEGMEVRIIGPIHGITKRMNDEYQGTKGTIKCMRMGYHSPQVRMYDGWDYYVLEECMEPWNKKGRLWR